MPLRRSRIGQLRTSRNPAAVKSRSKASVSLIRSDRIRAKLVASTKEYSRSSWRRNQRRAAVSRSGDTTRSRSRGERSMESRKSTAERCPARRRRKVPVSPRTWLLVRRGSAACLARSVRASPCELSRRFRSATQNDVSTNITDKRCRQSRPARSRQHRPSGQSDPPRAAGAA